MGRSARRKGRAGPPLCMPFMHNGHCPSGPRCPYQHLSFNGARPALQQQQLQLVKQADKEVGSVTKVPDDHLSEGPSVHEQAQSQVCQKSTAKGSGDDHTEDVEESSAAFTFSRSVSLEEPDTPRLFLSAAQSQPRVLSSGVLMWDAMAFGSKVWAPVEELKKLAMERQTPKLTLKAASPVSKGLNLCSNCCRLRAVIVALPCGHCALCAICIDWHLSIPSSTCPRCDSPVVEWRNNTDA